MWTWLASFLSGPLLGSLVKAYQAKLDAGNTSERIASDLAARELAVQQLEVQAQSQLKVAEVGHFWEPEKLFAYVILFYFGKVMIYDAAFGLGSTDAVHGAAGDWAGLVMMFYFGKRGVENVARILKR